MKVTNAKKPIVVARRMAEPSSLFDDGGDGDNTDFLEVLQRIIQRNR